MILVTGFFYTKHEVRSKKESSCSAFDIHLWWNMRETEDVSLPRLLYSYHSSDLQMWYPGYICFFNQKAWDLCAPYPTKYYMCTVQAVAYVLPELAGFSVVLSALSQILCMLWSHVVTPSPPHPMISRTFSPICVSMTSSVQEWSFCYLEIHLTEFS